MVKPLKIQLQKSWKGVGKSSVISNEDNQNNQIGVPLNILKLSKS